MRKMKQEYMYGVGGLVFGFLLGIVLVGAGGDGLFGTAADTGNGGSNIPAIEFPTQYYLVPLEEAQTWLQQNYQGDYSSISGDIDIVNGFGNTQNISEYYDQNQGSVNTVLLSLQNTLFSDTQADGAVTCVGINQDVYTGPGVYVYVEVTSDLASNVPDTWDNLGAPKENNMLWTTECLKD